MFVFYVITFVLIGLFNNQFTIAVTSTCGNQINNHTKAYCDNSTLSTITYISFLESSKTVILPAIQNELSEVKHADDSPYQVVNLPWPFNFFGENIYRFYVNPNGALHHNATSPSCGCYDIHFNSSTSSYKGIIAGFMIDLYPNGNPNSNITYGYTSNSMVVSFLRIPIFLNESLSNTFHISLFKNGQISILYDNIMSLSQRQYWMSGIRSLYSVSNIRTGHYQNHTRPSATVFTDAQLKVGTTEWQTDVAGIYPPSRLDVQNGVQFTTCPISTIWSAQPSFVDISPSLTSSLVSFSPLSISCLDKIEFTTSFATAPKNLSPCTSDVVNMRITCDILPISAGVSGPVTVLLWWRVLSTLSSFPLDAVPGIPLTLYTTQQPAIPPGQNCSLNSLTAGTCNSSPCDIYQHKLACLDQKCDSPTNPVVYDYPNYQCKNTCNNHTIYDQINNVCCSADKIDCNGECLGLGGDSKVAYLSYTTKTLVCCVKGTIDCLGVCGGSAIFDGCGICGGTNTDGHGCNTGINITTSSHSGKSIYSNFDVSSKHLILTVPAYINISNINSSSINVTLSYKSSFAGRVYAPRLIPSFSTKTFPIAPHSHSIIRFNVSIASLYSGNQTKWVVQIINVFVTRPIPNSTFFRQLNRQVSIYPSTIGCGTVGMAHTCSHLPGCIFCFEYNDIRVLRELNTSFLDEMLQLSTVAADLSTTSLSNSTLLFPASEDSSSHLHSSNQLNSYVEGTKFKYTETSPPEIPLFEDSTSIAKEDAVIKDLTLNLASEIRQDLKSGILTDHELNVKKMALYHYQRQLFPLVIPQSAGNTYFDDTVGTCVQGWLPDSCASSNKYLNGPGSSGSTSSGSSTSNVTIIIEYKYVYFVFLCAFVSTALLFMVYKKVKKF